MSNLSFIGAGRVGSTLAWAFRRKGHRVISVADSDARAAAATARAVGCRAFGRYLLPELGRSDIIILAVPDGEIGRTAEDLALSKYLRPGQIVCHTSGYLPAREMAVLKKTGVLTASFNPMFSVAFRLSPLTPKPYFGLEGEPEGVRNLRKLVKSCSWCSVVLKPEQKALYHAACVLATGMNISLLGLAQSIFDNLKHKRDSLGMVRSLASSAVANILETDLTEALTGPLVRGQAEVVAAHLSALKRAEPQAAEVYRILGSALLELLVGRLGQQKRKRILWLLKS